MNDRLPTPLHPAAAEAAPGRPRPRGAGKGRSPDAAARADLQAWLGGPPPRDRLIVALHEIQDRLHALPAAHLVALAHWMRLSVAEVYEVASFYHHFDAVREGDEPPPALTVRVCSGLPCSMAGSGALAQALPALLGSGVRVMAAPCVGRCDAAPVAVVHQQAVAPADAAAVSALVQAAQADPSLARARAPQPAVRLEAYRARGGYSLLARALTGQLDADALMQALDEAGLRGLGGAGFPAGRKWRIVRAQPAPRLLAVNIDEGEPGTFKDHWLLRNDPHRCLEGVLLAAWAVQAERVYLYLRDEYHDCRVLLQQELQALRQALLELPPIELRRGAGAYICGEESAMLESIEGKRGLPRLRPPYVAERGLFGRPTLVHNLETLAWVREIAERGGAWFAAQGRHGRRGLRHFSVSGRVRQPGVKRAPAGITLRELVEEHCGGMAPGHRLYAFLPGGASGGILPASLADLPLDFETLQPHGSFIGSAAVIVLSQADRAVDAARNLMDFFVHESCGQCTPCRAGTVKAQVLMARPHWDAPLLAELGAVMRDASICGLGQAAPNAFDSVLRHFAHEVQA